MTNTGPITIAFAGPGDSNTANTNDLLNDWLGFGAPDEEGYFEPSDREVTVILPVTAEQITASGFKNVFAWTALADLPFIAVTDSASAKKRAVEKILADAETVHTVANVEAKVVSMLADAKADGEEAVFVALWGDDEDGDGEKFEFAERLLSLADESGIPAKDLTEGLDDLTFKSDEEVAPKAEPEPDPEPEEAPKRRGRRRSAEPEEIEEAEEPLTEDDVKVPEPEPAPAQRTRAPRAAKAPETEPAVMPDDDDAAAEAKEVRPTKAEIEKNREVAKEVADDLRAQESERSKALLAEIAVGRRDGGLSRQVQADLENRFTSHVPDEATKARHTAVRETLLATALTLAELVPLSREQSLMLTHLEEVGFWANAGVARSGAAQASLGGSVGPREGHEPVVTSTTISDAVIEAPKRGRGRPRKDGTPAQPRTEDDLKVAYLEDEDGNLRKRGRGRTPKGSTVVMLSEAEVAEAVADGRIED